MTIGGCLQLGKEFDKFKDRITEIKFMDRRKLPEVISSVDINLMPLGDTFFNSCKSENI
jgi:hypothetical protein